MSTIGGFAVALMMSIIIVIMTTLSVAPGGARVVRWLKDQTVPIFCGSIWLGLVIAWMPAMAVHLPIAVLMLPAIVAGFACAAIIGYARGRAARVRRAHRSRKLGSEIRVYA